MRSGAAFTVAAVIRSSVLAVAVIRSHEFIEIIEVIRTRIRPPAKLGIVVKKYINRIVNDYDAKAITVERNRSVHRILRRRSCYKETVFTVNRKDIKRFALYGEPCDMNKTLFKQIVVRYPRLKRFVAVHRNICELDLNDPRRTAALFAVALGLAAHNVTR
jgi:hypothetical protein